MDAEQHPTYDDRALAGDARVPDPRPLSTSIAAVGEALRRQPRRRQVLGLLDDDPDVSRGLADLVTDVSSMRWSEAIPSRFAWASLDDLEPGPERDQLTDWATAGGVVPNLVLLGEVGVGKTHAAVAACRPAHEQRGAEVLFVPVGELLDGLDWRRPESPAYMEHLCQVDRLIIDDLGAERANEWTGERLYLVINRRWLDERPTVVTTNLEVAGRDHDDKNELLRTLGPRTYSRLAGGALAVRLSGPDRRRARHGNPE